MMNIYLKTLFIAFFSFIFNIANAQQLNPNDSIPLDPNVRKGKLDNGLEYYIMRNTRPENRIEMRLAVNAGSMQEDDNQKGLAHFTEHMCFNGTKNFPKNDLIDYLQQTGVKFGADINAYTSFDETVYMLQLPADNKELIDKGYQVLEDWAHNLTMDGKEIDKERGIITEEWRLGLGADDRMRKKYFPVIFKDSRYAERIPIGDIEIIKNFKHEIIRQFYNDWYRPDLMAVIIVGDIDPDEAEQKIITHFSKLQNPENPKERLIFDIPGNKEPLVAINTDIEATSTNIMIFYKHNKIFEYTLADYRGRIIRELFTGMLSERLNEYLQIPDAPFIYAYDYYGSFLARNCDAFAMIGAIKENRIKDGIKLLVTENERVKRFGFTQTELARMKSEMYSNYEKWANESDKTESGSLASRYVSNFLSDEPVPGAVNEFSYIKNFLAGIKLEEVNALAEQWVTDENLAIIITAPEKNDIIMPTEEEVVEIINSVKNDTLSPYEDKFRTEELIENYLPGSEIISKNFNSQNEFTELILSNGIKVIIKTTDFKNDEILFSAFSKGGTSLYSDEEYISAMFSSTIIAESGIGNFDDTELKKKLKGKKVEVTPYIQEISEGFTGKSTPKDIEELFKLTYLYFTAPRFDSTAFNANISRMKSQLKFISGNPVYAFMDTLIKTSADNDPRAIFIPGQEELDKINHKLLYKIFTDRFSDAGDFTFFLIGNINTDEIEPLIQKYIGSLPVTKRKESWKDQSNEMPEGISEIIIHKGTEPKGMVGIVMQESFVWSDTNCLYLEILKECINIKLIEVIREKLSGVYSPQLQMTYSKYPKSEYGMIIMFGCSPRNTDKLTKAVFKIINDIIKKGPSQKDLDKAKEMLIRKHEVEIRTNKYWLTIMENIYWGISSPEAALNYTDIVNGITIESVKQKAKNFFNTEHYVRTVLFPEKKKK